MKRIFLAALAAFFLCPAFAGELHLQLHGLSWHAEPQADGFAGLIPRIRNITPTTIAFEVGR